MSTYSYLKNFIKDKNVASVTPSSRMCVRHVCKKIDFSKDNIIIEYGPGTGVFTKYLLKRLTKDSILILFETNKDFVDKLNRIKDERVVVHNQSVENITEVLGPPLIGQVDYIISGIPFSFLEPEAKDSVLKQSVQLLKKGGKFLAYQTSGHLKDPLRKTFGNLHTEFEILNIPPMMIYEAVKGEEKEH
ncbi:MAG TPA: methyltransferase [Balneolales bacterium]|nr:methyltransferase [Balneolales bacterium]